MFLPLNGLDAVATHFRGRYIFPKQADQLYELLYAAPDEDYSAWLNVR